ncbi:hypothetical protein [Flavobacterium sp. SM2513]|uniref:hypothetical protein n=1 Tax=Flavobacterium sp. SM2513 TaxID=3424766 RepID=UPI003D7F6CD2
MKIKIVKIKVEDAGQEFDSSAFISGKHTVVSTHAELKEEDDGLYWHAFFTFHDFEIVTAATRKKEEKELYRAFHQEVLEFLKTHPTATSKAKNIVMDNFDNLTSIRGMNDFMKLRNMGKSTLTSNSLFFEELLEKIYSYSFNY